MYANSRPVQIGDLRVTTPLLIPSVSSKGFPLDSAGISEASLILEIAQDALGESLLISAYDLHTRSLSYAEQFLKDGAPNSPLSVPKLLVIDSGGYETSEDYESGQIDRSNYAIKDYSFSDFEDIIKRLPRDRQILTVSYDGPETPSQSYREQRIKAQSFFSSHSHLVSDFLLKPPEKGGYHEFRELAVMAGELRVFDVIGFTEKELGETFLDRLVTLARLREVLDDAGVLAPIHLFGALDPTFTPLYFTAGAEIFDGLSWMRYSYHGGLAVHPEVGSLLKRETDDKFDLRKAKRTVLNLGELKELKRQMERFAKSNEFRDLGQQSEILSETYATMRARIDKGA